MGKSPAHVAWQSVNHSRSLKQPSPLALPLMAWQSAGLFEIRCQHAAAARLCMQRVHKKASTACLHVAHDSLLKEFEIHRMQHAAMTIYDL